MVDAVRVRLAVPEGVDLSYITGPCDKVLRTIERETHSDVVVREGALLVSGSPDTVELLSKLFSHLFSLAKRGQRANEAEVVFAIDALRRDSQSLSGLSDGSILTHRGHTIRPKTHGQVQYVDAIRTHTITFGLGLAGTGKTYLAMAMAVAALKRHEVGRIVLTRPVVEAGESLGFLPGTLEDKIDPYIRPLFDALFDMMDSERVGSLIEQGVLEIAPLAYMRGRTLNDAYVVLDEAQNTTPEQMKMFLTRLGFNAKLIITGDMSQCDLLGHRGGLTDIESILGDVEDIAFIHLTNRDVVRHALVGRIVAAYDAFENTPAREEKKANKGGCRGGAHCQ